MAGHGEIRPHFKLWMSSPGAEGVFGDGKCSLLEAIDREGSLKGAAGALGMSYRKAWGDLEKAERETGVRLVERARGGLSGGRTELTDAGRRWIEAYRAYRAELEKALEDGFERHIRPLMEWGEAES